MQRHLSTVLLFCICAIAIFLRVYKIDTNPPGLYIDEASIAYNAHTILTTGNDEHGKKFPIFFEAFGEYKMPVYIYLTSISMALFGNNTFAVRIPSAFFGSFTVLVFYFFAKEIIQYDKSLRKKQQEAFALASTALLAISPWHIQFSRAGFEATVALCLYLLSILFFLYFYRKQKNLFLFLACIFSVLPLYTYDAFRVISPVSLVTIFLFIFLSLPKKRTVLYLAAGVLLFFALPILFFSFTNAGLARFTQASAFSGGKRYEFFTYPLAYIFNYFSFFSFSFLFSYGDGIGRHTVFRMGPLFKWEVIPLLLGVYYLIQEKMTLFAAFIFFLLFIIPLAGALAVPSPHLLRALPLIIPLTLLIGYGLIKLVLLPKKKYLLWSVLFLLAVFEFVLYLDLYWNYTTVKLPDWGNQYKILIEKIATHTTKDTQVFISTTTGMNGVYMQLYAPKLSYIFVDPSWKKPNTLGTKNVLYITVPDFKKDKYITTIPHTQIDSVTTPDKYKTVLYILDRL